MLSPRTGRPPKDDSRDNQYRIRLSDEELQKLDFCCEKTGLSKADVIRKGIDKVYQEIQD